MAKKKSEIIQEKSEIIPEIIPEKSERELLINQVNNFIYTYMQGRSSFVDRATKLQFFEYCWRLCGEKVRECPECIDAAYFNLKKATNYDEFYKNNKK
jgi:hypothetical protein